MSELDYDTQGLRDSIAHAKKNIKLYEQCIADQMTQIANYQKMITVLEAKKAVSEGIEIDAKTGVVTSADDKRK